MLQRYNATFCQLVAVLVSRTNCLQTRSYHLSVSAGSSGSSAQCVKRDSERFCFEFRFSNNSSNSVANLLVSITVPLSKNIVANLFGEALTICVRFSALRYTHSSNLVLE